MNRPCTYPCQYYSIRGIPGEVMHSVIRSHELSTASHTSGFSFRVKLTEEQVLKSSSEQCVMEQNARYRFVRRKIKGRYRATIYMPFTLLRCDPSKKAHFAQHNVKPRCIAEQTYYLFIKWTRIIIGLNKRVQQRTWMGQDKPTQNVAVDTELC
jgi:hypothetical protein